MSKPRQDPPPATPALSREQRLAVKLRENLRRRKVQARDLAEAPADGAADVPGTLPKSVGKS